MNNKRANSFNTGIAAEYFILSQLYRMGVEAYISQGNKKAIDIRIIKDNGVAISVDVKSVRSYSSFIVNNVTSKKNHFIVLVGYNNKFENIETSPDIFVIPSEKLATVMRNFKKEKRVLKNSIGIYKDRWDLLM